MAGSLQPVACWTGTGTTIPIATTLGAFERLSDRPLFSIPVLPALAWFRITALETGDGQLEDDRPYGAFRKRYDRDRCVTKKGCDVMMLMPIRFHHKAGICAPSEQNLGRPFRRYMKAIRQWLTPWQPLPAACNGTIKPTFGADWSPRKRPGANASADERILRKHGYPPGPQDAAGLGDLVR